MNISCQSVINVERPEQGISDLNNAGLDRVFLPVYVKSPEKEENKKYSPDTIRGRYEDSVKKCCQKNIRIAFIKISVVSVKSDRSILWSMLETSITQCLELCKISACGLLLMDFPVRVQNGNEEQIRHDFFLRAAKKARKYGVVLLFKNQSKDIGGHLMRGFCAEASDAAEWVDSLNNELGYEAFGFCVDTGTCNICGNDIQNFINTLGYRVKVVILRDNDGYKDASMLPFTSAGSGTDWLGVIRGLRGINFDGELAVDFSDTYDLFSPLLRPTLYPMVRKIVEYFKWQIEIENNLKKYKKFALFGAGNMCRNYMKCYGGKYSPLFTCDNNPRLWGTKFEGLEVKNPEELKKLSKDCCVVICNIYYREIETQLRKMGIENIGYFNDEYMPSFYFDRLDRGMRNYNGNWSTDQKHNQ